MDISISLCSTKNSFSRREEPENEPGEEERETQLPEAFFNNTDINLVALEFHHQSHHQKVHTEYRGMREDKIGKSIFMGKQAVELANIDAVFRITDHQSSIYDLRNEFVDNFSYADLTYDSGYFTEYLRWRVPYSKGYGMTIRSDKDKGTIGWIPDLIVNSNFKITYGEDKTHRKDKGGNGSLIDNWQFFDSWLHETESDGVNVLLGSIDEDDHQPIIYASLASSCVKDRVHFICRLSDLHDPWTRNMIYILSFMFEYVRIFKPLSSYDNPHTRYVVCTNRNTLPSKSLNPVLMPIFEQDQCIVLPDRFEKWLKEQDEITLQEIDEDILYYKALIIWNLPSNVDHTLK